MNIFSKVSLLGTSNLPKPWRPAFQSPQLATRTSWNGIAYGNGKFLAKARGFSGIYFSSSTDAMNWGTLYNIRFPAGTSFVTTNFLAWQGKFVLLDESSHISSSDDGVTWTPPETSIVLGARIVDFISDGEKFIAVDGQNSCIWTSTDGENFTRLSSYGSIAYFKKIAYNGEFYLANGANGYVYTTSNLINWTESLPSISNFTPFLHVLGYDGSRFFGNYNGQISYTENGVNWTTPITDSNLGGCTWTASTTDDIKTVLISSEGYISTKRI